jgi:putative two-component system response regulator
MMPDLDGAGLLEGIKVQFPALPVVLMTSVYDLSVALACFRLGASDYLLEPFERRQLLATIRRALENYRLGMDSRPDKTNLGILVAARTEQLQEQLSKPQRSDKEVSCLLEDEPAGYVPDWVVAAFTIGIARAMGLPREQIDIIARGASLRHVGQIPALRDILLQSDLLLPDELTLLCQLCHNIYEMLKPIPILADASEIIYAYAECFDGTGHPRALRRDKIPMGARILSVAHTVEAFTSPFYTYRAPQTVASAHAEIQRRSGYEFDPEVVRTVLSMPNQIWGDLRKQAQLHS